MKCQNKIPFNGLIAIIIVKNERKRENLVRK